MSLQADLCFQCLAWLERTRQKRCRLRYFFSRRRQIRDIQVFPAPMAAEACWCCMTHPSYPSIADTESCIVSTHTTALYWYTFEGKTRHFILRRSPVLQHLSNDRARAQGPYYILVLLAPVTGQHTGTHKQAHRPCRESIRKPSLSLGVRS